MTRDELAALDAKATKGTFEMLATDLEHDFGVPIVGTNYPGTYGPTNGLALWATMQPTEIDAKDATQAEANARFVTALVNAYRTGQLVMVPSVDDLIGVISDGHILVSDGRYRAFARAVLTSMGAKTDG